MDEILYTIDTLTDRRHLKGLKNLRGLKQIRKNSKIDRWIQEENKNVFCMLPYVTKILRIHFHKKQTGMGVGAIGGHFKKFV